MVPVDLAAIAVTLAALFVFFGKDIPRRYEVAQLRAPAEAIQDRATFRAGWVVLALLLVGFFVLDPLGVPVSAVAAVGAIVLIANAARGHVLPTRTVDRKSVVEGKSVSVGVDIGGRRKLNTK